MCHKPRTWADGRLGRSSVTPARSPQDTEGEVFTCGLLPGPCLSSGHRPTVQEAVSLRPLHLTFCEGRQPRLAKWSRPPYMGHERLQQQSTLPWGGSRHVWELGPWPADLQLPLEEQPIQGLLCLPDLHVCALLQAGQCPPLPPLVQLQGSPSLRVPGLSQPPPWLPANPQPREQAVPPSRPGGSPHPSWQAAPCSPSTCSPQPP